MSHVLVVTPEAEIDILEGYLWYEERSNGLGSEFVNEFEAALQRIIDNPMSYVEVEPEIRRVVVHTFPYLVFYTVDEKSVHVLAVIPAAQDPDYIRLRLGA